MVNPGSERPDEDGARRGDEGGVGADDGSAESIRSAAPPEGGRTASLSGPVGGRDLICRVAVWATGGFVVASALAAAWPDTFLPLSVPVDLVLFAVGCGTFLCAYALAIGRSRYETVTMGGVFFLSEGVAPPDVTRLLRGVLGVQVVVAVAAASVRPFTALAFSVLVPMLGLGLMALWAARHGRFPAKPSEPGD
jgi:hypothetical protein